MERCKLTPAAVLALAEDDVARGSRRVLSDDELDPSNGNRATEVDLDPGWCVRRTPDEPRVSVHGVLRWTIGQRERRAHRLAPRQARRVRVERMRDPRRPVEAPVDERHIGAGAALGDVALAVTEIEEIIPTVGADAVEPRSADELVVSRRPDEDVVPLPAEDAVVAPEAADHVGARRADEQVGLRRAPHRAERRPDRILQEWLARDGLPRRLGVPVG